MKNIEKANKKSYEDAVNTFWDFYSCRSNQYIVNRTNIPKHNPHSHAVRKITIALTHKEDYAQPRRRHPLFIKAGEIKGKRKKKKIEPPRIHFIGRDDDPRFFLFFSDINRGGDRHFGEREPR